MCRFITCIGLSLSLMALPAFASEIFHWVDEDGILHFSDWAPEDSDVEVLKLRLGRSNPPGYDPGQDENSVLQQAERIGDRWADIKQQRDERRQEQREAAERRQVSRYEEFDYPYYYRSGFYFPVVHRPVFGHRPAFRIQKRQALALDQLGLLGGPRPHSINSSAHLARVNASRSLTEIARSHRPARQRPPTLVKE